MLIHRLKIEFRENKFTFAIWVITLALLCWGILSSWAEGAVESRGFTQFTSLLMLPLFVVPLIATAICFNKDKLKSPVDFWISKPVRPFHLYGAKLLYFLIVYIVPVAVLTLFLSMKINETGVAFLNALEAALWISVVVLAVAFSCMESSSIGKWMLLPIMFIAGCVTFSIVTANVEVLSDYVRKHSVLSHQTGVNVLCGVLLLCVLCLVGIWLLIRNKTLRVHPIAVFGIALFLVTLGVLVPISSSTNLRTSIREVPLIKVTEPVMPRHGYTEIRGLNGVNVIMENYWVNSCEDVFVDSQPFMVLETNLVDESGYLKEMGIEIEAYHTFSIIPHISDQRLLNLNKLPIADVGSGLSVAISFPETSYKTGWYLDDKAERKLVTVKGYVDVSTHRVAESFRGEVSKVFTRNTNTRSFLYKPGYRPEGGVNDDVLGVFYHSTRKLPFITSPRDAFWVSGNFLLQHTKSGKWLQTSGGSSSNNGSVFGGYGDEEVSLNYSFDTDEILNEFEVSSLVQFKDELEIVGFEKIEAEIVRIPLEFQIVVPVID